MESNRRLESKIQEYQSETDDLREQNKELEKKAESSEGIKEHETEIKSRVEALLSKVDEVVGS